MPDRVLLSKATRTHFRELTASSTIGAICTAFEAEGFTPNKDHPYGGSQRRDAADDFLLVIDWTSPREVERALRAIESVIWTVRPDAGSSYRQWDLFVRALDRDGYSVDDEGRIVAANVADLAIASLGELRDPSAIYEQFDRMRRAMNGDPALVIGSAKELIESTAKVVLSELDIAFTDRDDLPKLVKQAQLALHLHPQSSGPDGNDGVRKILSGASSIAIGVAELRNRGYGTGHGPAGKRVGLSSRHAHLAANAALTWCQLMLDTLADPNAPWRTAPAATEAATTPSGST